MQMITRKHGLISEYNSKNIECTTLFIRIRYTTLKCGAPLIYELEKCIVFAMGKEKIYMEANHANIKFELYIYNYIDACSDFLLVSST